MKKLFKIIGIILAVIVILLVLAIVALETLVNPNDFKDQISQLVYQQTGRQLTIAGNIDWSFFPWLGVKVNDVSLSNASQFSGKTFAKVGEADIRVQVWSLLTGHIAAEKLVLKNFSLSLIKNKAGQTNWQDLTSKPVAKPAVVPKAAVSKPGKAEQQAKQLAYIAISAVNIDNANISWDNQQTGQTTKIQNFQLQSNQIALRHPFKISSSFDFQTTKPDYTGHIKLTSNVTLQPSDKLYSLTNLKSTGYIRTPTIKNNLSIKFNSNVTLNIAAQTFSVKNMMAQLANLRANGTVTGSRILTTPAIKGSLNIPAFNPHQFLNSLGKNLKGGKGSSSIAGTLVFQVVNNIINLNAINAKVYSGILNAQAKINTRGKIPRFSINTKLTNAQLRPLLSDFAGIDYMSGLVNYTNNLTFSGNNADAILRSLTGKGNIAIKNGSISGLNINYLLQFLTGISLEQFSQQQVATGTSTFNSLTASFVIHNGELNNNDLLVKAAHYQLAGKGTANLVNEKLNYKVQLFQFKVVRTPIFVPIRITGTFSEPRYTVDLPHLLQEIIKQPGKVAVKTITIVPKTIKGIGDISKEITKGLGKLLR